MIYLILEFGHNGKFVELETLDGGGNKWWDAVTEELGRLEGDPKKRVVRVGREIVTAQHASSIPFKSLGDKNAINDTSSWRA